jgi:hypothetical protein
MRHDQPRTRTRTFDGDTILHINELVEWLSQGYWIRSGGVPFHPSWIMQHKLVDVLARIGQGLIQRAMDVDGLPYVTSVERRGCGGEKILVSGLITPTPEQFEKAMREEL